MSERRASIRSPEMMNGSTNGIVASHEPTRRFELEQRGDEAVGGIEQQRVERPLSPRAVRGRVLRQRELEEGVELHALAAAPRIFDDHAARADVPGAAERAVRGGTG